MLKITIIKGCTNKQKFNTLQKAREASNFSGQYLNVYKCKNCKKYHFGRSKFNVGNFQKLKWRRQI